MSDVDLRNEEGRVDRNEEGRYNEDICYSLFLLSLSLRRLLLV